MANPALESFTTRALALKIEAVEGTDSLPTPALDAFDISEGTSGFEADNVERPKDRAYFSADDFIKTNLRGFIEGGFEVAPPDAPGVGSAAISPLLRIAGMAEVLTPPEVGPPGVIGVTRYNPITTGIPSATAYWYHSGTLRKFTACRANITQLTMAIGDLIKGRMRLQGAVDGTNDDLIEELAMPSDFDYDAFAGAEGGLGTTETMEMLVNDFAVQGVSHAIDFGNTLQSKQHTEARVNRINARKGTTALRFYRTSLGDLSPFNLWRTGSIVTSRSTQVWPDGSYTRFVSRGKVDTINETDIEGDYGWEITLRNLPSTGGGNEFYIEYGASLS